MKDAGGTLTALALQFAILSLLAFGGANAVVPEMHRQAVDVHRWMSDGEFVALFAIAQAAPGPNFLIATLVGLKAGGLPGAVIATLAMCAPSCLLTYGATRVWDRYRETRLRAALAAGLAPVTVGLVFTSAWILARSADHGWQLALVTLATGALAYFSRLNPLWFLAAAAGLGAAGLL